MSALTNFLSHGTTKFFQPHPNKERSEIDSTIQKRLAVLVGGVALGLPVVLALGAALTTICFRDSISHFYYSRYLGTVFVGCLVFIGGFLIAFSGESWLEDAGSTLAGIGACFVALFPTIGTGCEQPSTFMARAFVEVTQGVPPMISETASHNLFRLFPDVAELHAWGAGVVFIYLGVYCLVVLRRIVPERHIRDGKLIETKRKRNRLYAICGLVIIGCVIVLGVVTAFRGSPFHVGWNELNLTFFVEATALWAFGIAWFAKGRQFAELNDA